MATQHQHQQLPTPTAILGARLLKDVKDEEESLEDLLFSLRHTSHPHPHALTSLPSSLQPLLQPLLNTSSILSLAIHPSPYPLLAHIISHLITCDTTIALIDLTARFTPSHLTHLGPHLSHIHIFHPTVQNLPITLASVERYMLHGDHESKGRVWAGTIIIGETATSSLTASTGTGTSSNASINQSTQREISKLATCMKRVSGVLVTVNWRGNVRVEREEEDRAGVEGRGMALGRGISVEEAWKGVREREEGKQREEEGDVDGRTDGRGQRGWRVVWEGGAGKFRF